MSQRPALLPTLALLLLLASGCGSLTGAHVPYAAPLHARAVEVRGVPSDRGTVERTTFFVEVPPDTGPYVVHNVQPADQRERVTAWPTPAGHLIVVERPAASAPGPDSVDLFTVEITPFEEEGDLPEGQPRSRHRVALTDAAGPRAPSADRPIAIAAVHQALVAHDLEALSNALRTADTPRVRAHAALGLAVLGPKTPTDLGAIAVALSDPDPHVRHAAVLAALGGDVARPDLVARLFVAVLEGEQPPQRESLLRALGPRAAFAWSHFMATGVSGVTAETAIAVVLGSVKGELELAAAWLATLTADAPERDHAIAALIARARTGHAVEPAARALAILDPNALDHITDRLDPDKVDVHAIETSVATAGVGRLAELGPDAVPTLAHLLHARSPALAEAAATALYHADNGLEPARADLVQAIAEGRPGVLVYAAPVLGRLRPSADVAAPLLALCTTSDASIQLSLLEARAQLPADALPVVIEALGSRHHARCAINTLAWMGERARPALTALAAYAAHPTAPDRAAATAAIRTIGLDPARAHDAVPALLPLLADADAAVAIDVGAVLVAWPPTAPEAAEALIARFEPGRLAEVALAFTGADPVVVQRLLVELRSRRQERVLGALLALAHIGPRAAEAVPALLAAAHDARQPDAVREHAIRALVAVAPALPETQAAFTTALDAAPLPHTWLDAAAALPASPALRGHLQALCEPPSQPACAAALPLLLRRFPDGDTANTLAALLDHGQESVGLPYATALPPEVGAPALVPALIRMIERGVMGVEATKQLRHFGPLATPAVPTLLEHADALGLDGSQTLGATASPAALAVLLKWLAMDSPSAWDAVALFAGLGPLRADALPALLDALSEARFGPEAEQWTLDALREAFGSATP